MKGLLQRIFCKKLWKKIILGTSDPWSMRHSSQQPSDNQCIILKIDGFQNKLAVKKWQNSVHVVVEWLHMSKSIFSFNLQAWNYVSVYGLLDGLPHYRYVLPLSCTYMQKVQGLFHKGQADYLVGLLPPLIYVEQVKQHSVI